VAGIYRGIGRPAEVAGDGFTAPYEARRRLDKPDTVRGQI
jgi:hypothetical protein